MELGWPFLAALFGAFCLGVSKAGFPGLALVNVVIALEVFGEKASIGIVLPMLVFCDILVYPLFRKYSSWKAAIPLLLISLVGIVIGWTVLDRIDDQITRRIIGGIILFMLVLQLTRKFQENFLRTLPDSKGFLIGSGLAIGFTTMMANAAGAVYSIYGLVHRLPKFEFMGLSARLFLLINIIKLPFLADLDLITKESLSINLMLVPGILVGIFLGKNLLKRLPQSLFEWLLYAFSAIAAVRLLLF
ncbi:MAG: sulfite exporter TauE/SafE family protein [Verrucomicrobiota bacterium]